MQPYDLACHAPEAFNRLHKCTRRPTPLGSVQLYLGSVQLDEVNVRLWWLEPPVRTRLRSRSRCAKEHHPPVLDPRSVETPAGDLTRSRGARAHGVQHSRKPRRDRINSQLGVLLHVGPSPCASRDARARIRIRTALRIAYPEPADGNTLQTCHGFSLTDAGSALREWGFYHTVQYTVLLSRLR